MSHPRGFLNISRDDDSHFPGQPLPKLDNPFNEEIFLNIQPKALLAQPKAVCCSLGGEPDTTSLEAPFTPVLS